MNFKTVMIIKAVVCLVFGLLLLIVPGQLLGLLALSFGSGAALMTRLYGACLMGNLMLTWFGRNAEKSPARKAIILHLFVYDAIGFVASLVFQLSGVLSAFGWGVVFIYFFFTIAFGYLLIQVGKAA
jgi:hypothetical protein